MSNYIDLHIHSVYSDGLLTVKEIFEYAQKKNLKAISITDHDTIDCIDEALELSNETGIEFIPGIELSSNIGKFDVHVLGYFFDYKNDNLIKFLNKFKEARIRRAEKMVKLLNNDGIKVSFDELEEIAGSSSSIGRPHLAQLLVEKGYARTFIETFRLFLGDHTKYYVKKYNQPPRIAAKIIQDAGGAALIAHPVNLSNDSIIFNEVLKSKIDGLEIIHPSHSSRDFKQFEKIVNHNNFVMSGGSDCHGGRRAGNIIIGEYKVPYEYVIEIKKYLGIYKEKKKKRYIF